MQLGFISESFRFTYWRRFNLRMPEFYFFVLITLKLKRRRAKGKESGGQNSQKFGRNKKMQTLTDGSFLNLENASTVEALKFTAARLAEHTASVVAGKINIPSLNNLASNLWEKAEYVARDTERRQLRQIFVENFVERLCELKPDARATNSVSETTPDSSSTENGDSKQTPETEITGGDENKNAPPEDVSSLDGQSATDEFLGFVKSDEPFQDSSGERFETPDAAEKAPLPEVQNPVDSQPVVTEATESAESEPKTAQESAEIAAEKPNLENQTAELESKLPEAKTAEAAKSQTVVAAKNESASGAVKSGSNAQNSTEPFEFEKCTININLSLLPAGSDGGTRNIILSAASHGLPPEIDFLEINTGDDLTAITDLVRQKFVRFKQSLPVKYIERLRASKNKLAAGKSVGNAKAASPVEPPANNLSSAKKESGEQSAQAKVAEIDKAETSDAGKNNVALSAPTSSVQSGVVKPNNAAKDAQPSLF